MELTTSGLPIWLDEQTGELSFGEGVLCDGHSEKRLGQMEGLFASIEGEDPDALVYYAYRHIRRAEDEQLFLPRDMRYDITVVLPGDANGEFFKTSGHFHGFGPQRRVPYPELYEVLAGEICFVLQADHGLARDGAASGKLDYVRVVHVKAGEAIAIPPWCGHGSINPVDQVSAFSNLAVPSCPMFYDAVKAAHGLAVRIVREGDGFAAMPNPAYGSLPEARVIEAVEAPEFGIEFGVPCYGSYVAHPERYQWLPEPDGWAERMEAYVLADE